MLATLITHPGDRNLALQLCQQIQALGGVANHEALIVAPNGTDMNGIEDVLKNAFGRVETLFYAETMRGWPYGPNESAFWVMTHIHGSTSLKFHYLMLETDCIPVAKFWLDRIDAEYRRCGMPILGVKIDTKEIGSNRVVGKHTVGVAVYPKNFPQICPLVRSLRDMTSEYQRQNAIPMPWDAYFGPYAARLTAETHLIQHLSRVRQVGPKGEVTWDCPSVDNAMGQVNRDAVLIHGSKTPAFFSKLTGRAYAISQRKLESYDSPKFSEDAPRQAIRESEASPRDESRQQDGAGRGVEQSTPVLNGYSLNAKVRAKQIKKKEAIRKELGIEAQIDTPEFNRSFFFFTQDVKWADTRSYAGKNLRINVWRKSKAQLVNEIVAIEIKQRKEPWTKALPPIRDVSFDLLPKEERPLPVEEAPLANPNFAVSQASRSAIEWADAGQAETAAEADARASNVISPQQQERMRQLLADRQAAGMI
jgi:hypothetical protein